MSESSGEVAEKYKSLFKGYRFNFEGFTERTREHLVKLVTKMGAEVSDDATYTFVEKSYFQNKENNTKDCLYDIQYIIDAVEKVDANNMSDYKLAPIHRVSNDEPMCYSARYFFKTDSCHKCYYKKVFCKDCVESMEVSEKDDQYTIAIMTDSDATDSSSQSEDEIESTPKKKVEKNGSDTSKRFISSESEDNSNDEVRTKAVNGKSKSPPRKKLKNSNDTDDETMYEHMSPENAVENNDSKSDANSLNNSGKEKKGELTIKESKEIKSPIKQRAVTINSSQSSVEDDDASESSINDDKKQLQNIDQKGMSWIQPMKLIPPPRKEEPVEPTDEESDGIVDDFSTEGGYFKQKKWWLPHDIPEKKQCTIPTCTFEPQPHPAHQKPRKFLSMIEKKILVKYLINNDAIELAKGKTIYEKMINDGYLSHRTWETLRNCFRRTILKEIKSYRLEASILNQFSAHLDD